MRTLLSAALLFAIPVLAAGQTPPASQTGQPEDKAKRVCTLEGQVVNQVTSAPVRKASIALKPTMSVAPTHTVESDAEGKFTIENVEPGRYWLSAARPGFVRMDYGARRANGPGTLLTLAAAQHLKDLTFKLVPQGVIMGRVLDDEGEPVAGVMVQVLQQKYVEGRKRLAPVAAGVQTNDLGEYRAANLPPGRYYVAVSPQRMDAASMLQSGTERAAGKTEPEEGNIPTYYPNSPDAASASTVEVGAGTELGGTDVRVRKGRVVRVSGTLMDGVTGAPMRSAMLMLLRREAGAVSFMPVSISSVQNEKGTFELRNISPGPYTLMAMSVSSPQDMKMTMSSIDVGDQNQEGVTINLGAGLEIPVLGKMEPADTKKDLGGVRVMLTLEDNPMGSLASAQLEKDGKALLKRVNPDKYRLAVSGVPEGYYLKAARLGSQDVLEAGVDLRQGGGGALELLVASPGAALSGNVVNDKGEAVPGALVTVVPKDPKGRTDLFRTGSADQNGSLRIGSVVPGEYKLFAWEDIEPGAAEDEEFRKPFDSRAVTVKLDEGAKQSVQLTLIPRDAVQEQKARQ